MKKKSHFLLLGLCGTATSLLISCSGSGEDTAQNSTVIESPQEIIVSVKPQLPRLQRAQQALMDGGVVSLDLNNCPFDDSAWDGASDPLGGVQCGHVYKVSFDKMTGEWTGVGFDEYRLATTGQDVTKTFKRVHPEPVEGAVILWGGSYILLEDGQVAMPRSADRVEAPIGTYTF